MNTVTPPDLVALLRCPKCGQPVSLQGEWIVCQNTACGLRYPVREGIPVMLIEEADPPPARNREPAIPT
jgi:uncharacterized protein YbaR (Trm112 family)